MQNNMKSVFVFSMSVMMFLVPILADAAPVFSDNFDRANGSVGNGWVAQNTGSGTFSINNNRVRVVDNLNTGDPQIIHTFAPTDEIEVTFDMKVVHEGAHAEAFVNITGTNGGYGYVLLDSDSHKVDYATHTERVQSSVSYSPGTTHQFRIVASGITNRYSIWMDGNPVAVDAQMRNTVGSFNQIKLAAQGGGHDGIFEWDNVVVTDASTTPLPAPTDLDFRVGDSRALLTWNHDSDLETEYYEVYIWFNEFQNGVTSVLLTDVYDVYGSRSVVADGLQNFRWWERDKWYTFTVRGISFDGLPGEMSSESRRIRPRTLEVSDRWFSHKPILLVHGIASGAETWEGLRFDLFERGLDDGGEFAIGSQGQILSNSTVADADIYTIDFVDNEMAFVTQGKGVGNVLAHINSRRLDGGDKINVVGHSMGGLATRTYLQNLADGTPYQGDIGLLVTTGTPHRGAQIAEIVVAGTNFSTEFPVHPIFTVAARILDLVDPFSPAINDLRASSSIMTQLNQLQPGLFDLPIHNGERYVSIMNYHGLFRVNPIDNPLLDGSDDEETDDDRDDMFVLLDEQDLESLLLERGSVAVGQTSTIEVRGKIHFNPGGRIGAFSETRDTKTIAKVLGLASTLEFLLYCPVQLEVTDPRGYSIDVLGSALPTSDYQVYDIDGDGEEDKHVTIVGPSQGTYQVRLIPEPHALPGDTYDLEVRFDDNILYSIEDGLVDDIASMEPIEIVINETPVAAAGADQTLECVSHDGATVTLDGSASTDSDSTPDTNDDIVLYEWLYEGEVIDTGATVDIQFGLGTYDVVLRVTDSFNATHEDTVQITVEDTTAPTLSLSSSTHVLWPANHKLRDVHVTATSTDICDKSPLITLISVTSSDPDDGKGDGNTKADIQDATLSTADFDIKLRAERSGKTEGRVYTLVYRATDSSGNSVDAQIEVEVPHDSSSHYCEETDCQFNQN